MTGPDQLRRSGEPRLVGHSGYLARRAAVRADALVRAALPEARSLRDVAVLAVLARGLVSQAELGGMLRVNRTAMISVIDVLERDGLVVRRRDPADRRRYALAVTEPGRAELAELTAAVAGAERELLADLAPGDGERLVELLRLVLGERAQQLPSPPGSWACFLLGHLAQCMRARSEDAFRGLGLEPRCVRMLVALDAGQPCTQERLARAMAVTAPTIVGALDEMYSNGLILRDRNVSDRREHVLRLSVDGKQYLSDALHAEDGVQGDLADRFGDPAIAGLNELLAAIAGPAA